MKKKSNSFPTIYVHGLGGWGQQDGLYKLIPQNGLIFDLSKALNKAGYETYTPSLSPFAGAWDRCCELWAQLMGGTVDYGKVHSEKYGHKRYGRTYPGILKDWGTKGDHEKINLIGHSFGGPVVKMFSDLILNGSAEEIAGTPADELSPLFQKNKPQKLHTVTTLSGVNNGTLFASAFGQKGMTVITYALTGVAALIGDTFVQKIYDFGLDEWGLTEDPRTCHMFHFRNPLKFLPNMKAYNANLFDSVAKEMQIEVAQDIVNPSQTEGENVYYFARRADRSFGGKFLFLPTLRCCIPCNLTELITGNIIWPHLRENYGVTDAWKPNDGMVNVIGQSAPLTSKFEDYEAGMEVKPGQWYNFPVENKDHFSWAGLLENPWKYFKYNKAMIEFLNGLKSVD